MFYFLILSFLSGIIELGAVYLGIVQQLPIHMIIMLTFFYQIGNIMTNILPQRTSLNIFLAGVVGLLSIMYYLYPDFRILAVQLVLSSFCIQIVRVQYKSSCPAWLKRIFRIGGFALSPIMLIGSGQAIFLLSVVLCIFLAWKNVIVQVQNKKILKDKKTRMPGISLVMIFHQMHYFVYTYVMPIYFFRITKSIWLSSLIFSVTWIVYLLPQTIAEKISSINYRKMFFFCHIFLGICMASIAASVYFYNTAMVLIFWILTGLGGGSVFCIKYLSKKYKTINMDFSENIGHFLGPLVAAVSCQMKAEDVFVVLPAISCIFVIMALISSAYIVNKEEYRHGE